MLNETVDKLVELEGNPRVGGSSPSSATTKQLLPNLKTHKVDLKF